MVGLGLVRRGAAWLGAVRLAGARAEISVSSIGNSVAGDAFSISSAYAVVWLVEARHGWVGHGKARVQMDIQRSAFWLNFILLTVTR
jgi:hypothetical protein